MKKELKELIEKFEEDLKEYEKLAEENENTYDGEYYDGVYNGLDIAVLQLKKLLVSID